MHSVAYIVNWKKSKKISGLEPRTCHVHQPFTNSASEATVSTALKRILIRAGFRVGPMGPRAPGLPPKGASHQTLQFLFLAHYRVN